VKEVHCRNVPEDCEGNEDIENNCFRYSTCPVAKSHQNQRDQRDRTNPSAHDLGMFQSSLFSIELEID
jgi:hypothetical protein